MFLDDEAKRRLQAISHQFRHLGQAMRHAMSPTLAVASMIREIAKRVSANPRFWMFRTPMSQRLTVNHYRICVNNLVEARICPNAVDLIKAAHANEYMKYDNSPMSVLCTAVRPSVRAFLVKQRVRITDQTLEQETARVIVGAYNHIRSTQEM